MTHKLKIHPKFFEAVILGNKTFEIRRNDRNFKVGDRIVLKEYSKETGYTGESAVFNITYVMTDSKFVKKGFAVLGIKPYNPFIKILEEIRKAGNTTNENHINY